MQSLVNRYQTKADKQENKRRSKWLAQDMALPNQSSEPEQQLGIDAERAFEKPASCFPDPPRTLPPPLRKPVFIPQRRQGDRLRGFQMLYAPALADSGVTEQHFIAFLSRLNVAIGFDNKLKIFNFAIDVGTIAVSSWELLVAIIATQALTTTAAHAKSRAKSEAYIAHANQRLFHPRGLHAQIVSVSSVVVPAGSADPSARDNALTHNEPSTFQFSLGSPNVLPEDHPKARGGFFNLNKRPIDYDPFDYGPGYVKITSDQYSPMRPSQITEPASSLIDKAAQKVEKYNVWQDRLPAKKNARRNNKRQETIDAVRSSEGEGAVLRFLQQEEQRHQDKMNKDKSKLDRLLDRNKVILIMTNLDDQARNEIQQMLDTSSH